MLDKDDQPAARLATKGWLSRIFGSMSFRIRPTAEHLSKLSGNNLRFYGVHDFTK